MGRVFGTIAVCALVAPLALWADPYGDLMKAAAAFSAAKSYHAEEHFPNGRTSIVDYSAPDRWRIQPDPKVTELAIGSDVYMVHNGKSTKLPFGGGMIRNMLDQVKAAQPDDEVKQSARDLGMQTVKGRSVHGYSYTAQGTPVTIYLGSDSLPIERVIHNKKGDTIIDYSNYNVPVTIEP